MKNTFKKLLIAGLAIGSLTSSIQAGTGSETVVVVASNLTQVAALSGNTLASQTGTVSSPVVVIVAGTFFPAPSGSVNGGPASGGTGNSPDKKNSRN